MGWFYSRCTRAQLIQQLIAPSSNGITVAHTLRGNVLWSVVQLNTVPPGSNITGYIRCDLLQRHGDEWGYKPLDEGMHPYYYSCPLSYLNRVPVLCQAWRDNVVAYHQAQALGRKAKRRL